jgi:DeoR/GlpR family transcriptional regulator of sugar metabolism
MIETNHIAPTIGALFMRVPLHIVERRRDKLRGLIRTDGFLPVAAICQRLGISEATARRDLVAVAANGQITRTRGGALADYNASFASHGERAARARSAKDRIAAAAALRIPSSGTIFLDAGTTIQALGRRLLQRRDFTGLRVVTNSLPIATMLGGAPGIELHVLGGTFLHRQAVLLGDDAVRSLRAWKFDAAFLGGEGLVTDGVVNSHAEIVAFQRAVHSQATKVFFCLDATKLGHHTPHPVVPWTKKVILITDASDAGLKAADVHLRPAQLVFTP